LQSAAFCLSEPGQNAIRTESYWPSARIRLSGWLRVCLDCVLTRPGPAKLSRLQYLMKDLNHVSCISLLVLLRYVSRAPPHDAYGGGPPPPPRGTCSPSLGRRGDSSRGGRRCICGGRGGGRRGGWLWADRNRHTATLTRVGVCEALRSEMQGRGEMATSMRRDGTHVSGNAAATTAEPTHTITTAIAAAATTRRAAGQECSMV